MSMSVKRQKFVTKMHLNSVIAVKEGFLLYCVTSFFIIALGSVFRKTLRGDGSYSLVTSDQVLECLTVVKSVWSN